MFIRRFEEKDALKASRMIADTLITTNSKDYPIEYIEMNIRSHSPEVLIERAKESHMYVVCDKESVIGIGAIVGYWGSENESILLTIFISPSYQKQGIGRMIIETLEQDPYFKRAFRV